MPTERLIDGYNAQSARIVALEGQTRELLVAIQGDPYFHGVWAWREGLATDSISYQHTPEAVRVVQAFARLEALLGLRDELPMPERSPDPTARAADAELLSPDEAAIVLDAFRAWRAMQVERGIQMLPGFAYSSGWVAAMAHQAEQIKALEGEAYTLRVAIALVAKMEGLRPEVAESLLGLLGAGPLPAPRGGD